ncbi:acyloxyacyl hydrolase [Polaribacter sp.]|nr:acyloxyacyl hydrolase [Polaribacter sp.]MDC1237660.1 acyloxyacyl hydrolase [Polaribacter sp.]
MVLSTYSINLEFFFGKKRAYNVELRIMHYSNGNIFLQNSGVAIPIQFTFGKTF